MKYFILAVFMLSCGKKEVKNPNPEPTEKTDTRTSDEIPAQPEEGQNEQPKLKENEVKAFGFVSKCASRLEAIGDIFPPDWALTNKCSRVFEGANKADLFEKMSKWKTENCQDQFVINTNDEAVNYQCVLKADEAINFQVSTLESAEGWSVYFSLREECGLSTLPEGKVVCEQIN